MSEWQPIETAPKDETKFLGWNKDFGARETYYRFYGEGSSARVEYEKGFGPRGSYEWHEPQSGWLSSWKPTHWMRLPKPPEKDAA